MSVCTDAGVNNQGLWTRQSQSWLDGPRPVTAGSQDLRCVVKADLLQLGQCASGTRNQNSAVHQIVGQFRGKRGMGAFFRVDVEFDEGRGVFPNRIVARHENNTAPHQRGYRVIVAGEWSRRTLIVGGVGCCRLPLGDQRIGLELDRVRREPLCSV
jgi:hypothetical protein